MSCVQKNDLSTLTAVSSLHLWTWSTQERDWKCKQQRLILWAWAVGGWVWQSPCCLWKKVEHTQTHTHTDTYQQHTPWVRITGSYCNHPSSHHFSVPKAVLRSWDLMTLNPLLFLSLLHLSLPSSAPLYMVLSFPSLWNSFPWISVRGGCWNKEFLLLSYEVYREEPAPSSGFL